MLTGKFLLTTVVIAIAISFIQWFFIAFLFHKYQALTPATWRKESNRSYAASMILTLVFAFMFTTIFYLWKSRNSDMHLLDGVEFGVVCWFTFSLISGVESAIYVNYSRFFALGKCLSSLVEYVVAGILAILLL